MAESSYTKGEERPPGVNPRSPEGDRPDAPDVAAATDPYDVDISFWEKALADAERAEKDWRGRGREIVQIYRGDIPITRPKTGRSSRTLSYATGSSTFNILYANTEVMLPAAYAKPPDPVVRSRFVKKSAVPAPPPAPPIIPGGFGLPPSGPPGMGGPPPPGAGPPGEPAMPSGPGGPAASMAPPGGPMLAQQGPQGPISAQQPPPPGPPPPGAPPPAQMPGVGAPSPGGGGAPPMQQGQPPPPPPRPGCCREVPPSPSRSSRRAPRPCRSPRRRRPACRASRTSIPRRP